MALLDVVGQQLLEVAVKDLTLAMMSPGVAVQVNGFAPRFQFSMYDWIVLMSTRREVNVPRLIACLVMMLNQISTWFNQELPVG